MFHKSQKIGTDEFVLGSFEQNNFLQFLPFIKLLSFIYTQKNFSFIRPLAQFQRRFVFLIPYWVSEITH